MANTISINYLIEEVMKLWAFLEENEFEFVEYVIDCNYVNHEEYLMLNNIHDDVILRKSSNKNRGGALCN